MDPVLRSAQTKDLPLLCRYIHSYYRCEGIDFNLLRVERALLPLLRTDNYGRVWVIESGRNSIGYAVLCFGYSIESGGREALIDEFYIDEDQRGRGFGRRALDLILDEARSLGVVSIYLELGRDNIRGRELYRCKGFTSRDDFLLMRCALAD